MLREFAGDLMKMSFRSVVLTPAGRIESSPLELSP